MSLHHILDTVSRSPNELGSPLWQGFAADLLKNAGKFQRFQIGTVDWMFEGMANKTGYINQFTEPFGLLAPRTYLEFTLASHKKISQRALIMWSVETLSEVFEDYRINPPPGYDARWFMLACHSPKDKRERIFRWTPDLNLTLFYQNQKIHTFDGEVLLGLGTREYGEKTGTSYFELKHVGQNAAELGPLYIYIYHRFLEAVRCTNVEVRDNPAPTNLNKKRVSRGHTPIFSYKTLHLKSGKILTSESGGGTHGSPRLHFRRGHPRRLKSGKSVWVTGHMVGDEAKGKVIKDYEFEG